MRWLAEPGQDWLSLAKQSRSLMTVRSVIIPTDAFLTNKQGFPASWLSAEFHLPLSSMQGDVAADLCLEFTNSGLEGHTSKVCKDVDVPR